MEKETPPARDGPPDRADRCLALAARLAHYRKKPQPYEKKDLSKMNPTLAYRRNTPSTPRITGICLLIFAALATLAHAAPLTDEEKSLANQINGLFRRAAEQVAPAVVSLQISKTDGNGQSMPIGLGSGCIIDKAGYVITNNHVVQDTDKITVYLADGRKFDVVETATDPATDLAVVRFDPGDQDLPVAAFGDSDQLHVGDCVLAIGNPFGLDQTVTSGIVSYLGRQTHILGEWGLENFIQTDAAINRGNSGGPLVNLYGEVVGVNSNILTPTGQSAGYGFAVPSAQAQRVAKLLIEEKTVKRGYLGIRMNELADVRSLPEQMLTARYYELSDDQLQQLKNIPESQTGVLVINVTDDSPAAQVSIKPIDLILKINDQPVATSRAIQDIIANKKPGEKVTVLVYRQGEELPFEVTLGDRGLAREEMLAQRQVSPPQPGDRPDPFWFQQRPGPDGQSEQPKLGVGVVKLTPNEARKYGYDPDTQGIVIGFVGPGTLADKAGLAVGDIILQVDDETVDSVRQLKDIVKDADLENQGLTLTVKNLRGQRQVLIKANAD